MGPNLTLRKRQFGRRHCGYQLLELVVVIAIMAFLAAILFPVFSKVRERARRSSCQSNLKQIGMAIQLYAQDWDESYMPTQTITLYPDGNWSSMQAWMDLIYPYAKTESMFDCPSNSDGLQFRYSRNRATTNAGRYGSYVGAGVYWGTDGGGKSVLGDSRYYISKTSDLIDPSQNIMVGDGVPGRITATFDVVGAKGQPVIYPSTTLKGSPRLLGRSDTTAYGFVERHGGTTNVLWADGHVKALRLEGLMIFGDTSFKGYKNPQKYLKYFTNVDD